jgi:hypothetical protein
MKIGHSNLLGHLVESKDTTVQEVADMLVVCPECRSPIYKMQRGEGENAQHFFSHYPAQKDTAKECELRVARYTTERVIKERAKERLQNLKFFLAALDEMMLGVMEAQRGEIGEFERRLLKGISKSKNVSKLGQEVKLLTVGAVHHEDDYTKNRLGLDIKDSYNSGLMIRPRLSYEHQHGYAKDLFETLIRPECTSAYLKLQQYAWLLTLDYFRERAEDLETDPTLNFCLLYTSDEYYGVKYWMSHMVSENIAQIKAVFSTFIYHILLSIDYGDWLFKRQNNIRLQKLRWSPDRVFNRNAKHPRIKPKRTHRIKKSSKKQRKAS